MNNNFLPYQLKKNSEQANNLAASLAQIATQVTSYGADPSGVKDSTTAIQNAINHVQSLGGGIIYFPPGTYFVKADYTQAQGTAGDGSSFPNGSCIVITGSNVTLLGAGKDKTKIQCHASNGGVFETNYNLIDYNNTGTTKVWRGGGIGILGGTSSSPQQNITIRGIELDGTAHYTGTYTIPANTSTGDGWDRTHRGVWLKPDTYLYNVLIDDCYIHSFKGELTYGVGQNLKNLVIQNCKFDDSNAEATNFLNGIIKNNTVGQMPVGFEIVPYSGHTMIIKDNVLNGPFIKEGIYLRTYDSVANSTSFITCEHNQIYGAQYGIFLSELKNAIVRNNIITDSTTYGMRIVASESTQPRALSNVHIENNKVIQRTVSNTGGCGYSFLLSTYGATKSRFVNNTAELANDSLTGVAFNDGIVVSSGSFDSTCAFFGNYGTGTVRDKYDSMVANNFLVPNTSNNNIIRYDNPRIPKLYRMDVTYRVVTACNVHLWVQYTDITGATQTIDVANVASQAVGTYNPSSISVYANTGSPVYLIGAMGSANAVYVSAKLAEV